MPLWTVVTEDYEIEVFASVKEVLDFTGTGHSLEGNRLSKSTRKAIELSLTENRLTRLYPMRDAEETVGEPCTAQDWKYRIQRQQVDAAGQKHLDGAVICAYELPDEVRLELVRQRKGPPLWAVRRHGMCMGKDGEWEWEPSPSNRDDAFLARCRFAMPQEAADIARKATTAEATPDNPTQA